MRKDVELVKCYEKKQAIFVDADACPVKEEISQIATNFKMGLYLLLHIHIK